MNITGTLVWYYYICQRETWLMSRQINPFQDHDFLEIGRIIHDEAYRRDHKEIRFDNTALDVVKNENGVLTVSEVKKSSRSLRAARMQLAFYLWKLEQKGYTAVGELRFPKEKRRVSVTLTPELKSELEKAMEAIRTVTGNETPPPPKKIPFCRRCAYREFCWS